MYPNPRIYFKKNLLFEKFDKKKEVSTSKINLLKLNNKLLIKDDENKLNNCSEYELEKDYDYKYFLESDLEILPVEVKYFSSFYDKIYNIIINLLIIDNDKEFVFDNENLLMIFQEIKLNAVNPNIKNMKILLIKFINELNFFVVKNWKSSNNLQNQTTANNLLFSDLTEYIHHFKKLFLNVRDNYKNYEKIKKLKFDDYLISFLEYYQDLENMLMNLDYTKSKNINLYSKELNPFDSVYSKTDKIDFIPIAGNKNVKSFFMSDSCVSNFQYMQFVNSGEYFKNEYWSIEGLMWKKYYKASCPLFWENRNGTWYVKGKLINLIYNYPVENICYYEAEAYAAYRKCRLPTEIEWNFVASNRNKTLNPNGIYIPDNLSCNFEDRIEVKSGEKSLLGFYNLYGNVWEFTTSIRKKENSEIEICLKGGDSIVPDFILNNDLKIFILKINRNLSSGIRLVHD